MNTHPDQRSFMARCSPLPTSYEGGAPVAVTLGTLRAIDWTSAGARHGSGSVSVQGYTGSVSVQVNSGSVSVQVDSGSGSVQVLRRCSCHTTDTCSNAPCTRGCVCYNARINTSGMPHVGFVRDMRTPFGRPLALSLGSRTYHTHTPSCNCVALW